MFPLIHVLVFINIMLTAKKKAHSNNIFGVDIYSLHVCVCYYNVHFHTFIPFQCVTEIILSEEWFNVILVFFPKMVSCLGQTPLSPNLSLPTAENFKVPSTQTILWFLSLLSQFSCWDSGFCSFLFLCHVFQGLDTSPLFAHNISGYVSYGSPNTTVVSPPHNHPCTQNTSKTSQWHRIYQQPKRFPSNIYLFLEKPWKEFG